MQRRDFLTGVSAAGGARLLGAQIGVPQGLPLPEWAQTGNFVHMGMDAGPLEAEKGLRSGWQHFTRDDPAGVVQAIRDYYRPENVEIPKTFGANWIYVTWTNGWSKEREKRDQWPIAARFMEECRKHGIHTTVYISAANMFWEDYFTRVPQSRKWVETLSPGWMRHYGGNPERLMANVKLPEWRNELKTAIDASLDAGAEGFWVDNLFPWHGQTLFNDLLHELQAHAARRRNNLVWHTNVNAGIYSWAKVGNVVGTEDGKVPRFDPGADPPVTGNLGLLSFLSGLTEGWRSVELEHYGNDLSAAVRQLMIAECWMWQVGCTGFPTDRLLQAKWHRRETDAWRVLEAMGTYNRHQLRHRQYFQRAEPLATLGVVGHLGQVGPDQETQQRTSRGQGELIGLLNVLAGWNVQYEVLFEDRLQPETLKKFSVVVAAHPDQMPPGAGRALAAYASGGGTVLAPEGATLDFAATRLPEAAFRVRPAVSPLLRDALRKLLAPGPVEVSAPAGIVYRALRQGPRVLVHLVNYTLGSTKPITVRYRGPVSRTELLTPEAGEPRKLDFRREGEWTAVSVDVPIHCLLSFEATSPRR